MFDFYNVDFYDTILRDILGVHPTGDVVADTVYLFVLPVLTLFLFSHHVSGLLSLGKSKLQYVFMAIVFFFVIQRGYYPFVAQYSLFAFVILMIWGAWTFITGKKYDDKGNPMNMKSYNMAVDGGSSTMSNIKTLVYDKIDPRSDLKRKAAETNLYKTDPTAWAIMQRKKDKNKNDSAS
ncbi:MAG: hypothetical protein KAJ24_04460 [Candidatus Aenigmarchaeota archaeon]|nr:hypothetical protein [Candidatus Aenigmarchaeota archaeon]